MLMKRQAIARRSFTTVAERRHQSLLDALRDSSTAAMVSDARGRVVFWNRAAEKAFSRPAGGTLGRRCHELIQARDVFGNRFCAESCPVLDMARRDEKIKPFEWQLAGPLRDREQRNHHVQILRLPADDPEDYSLVHLMEPIDQQARLSRLLSAAGPKPATLTDLLPATAGNGNGSKSSPPLTRREKEVLACIARGLQNKEIAVDLQISLATTRNHVHAILEKLEVHSKLEALALAMREGWAQVEPSAPA